MGRIVFEQLIIQETPDLLVINKPAGISSLTDRQSDLNILDLSKTYFSACQLCHRLDKDTSGILLIAKSAESYRHISMQLEKRTITKEYHALVAGVVDNLDVCTKPISISGKGEARIDVTGGKPATTRFKLLEQFLQFALIACFPITGRMHQIRLHAAISGYPLVGDAVYGGKDLFLSKIKRKYNLNRTGEETPIIQRQALHAYGITYVDLAGNDVSHVAPYPKDFEVALKQLRRFNAALKY